VGGASIGSGGFHRRFPKRKGKGSKGRARRQEGPDPRTGAKLGEEEGERREDAPHTKAHRAPKRRVGRIRKVKWVGRVTTIHRFLRMFKAIHATGKRRINISLL
jgi:hypothetical protein